MPAVCGRNTLESMMLRINIVSRNQIATLYCAGRVVFGFEVETLRSIAKSRPERFIAIDLKGIETIDASGLGLLVELQHWATKHGRRLQFVNATEFVLRLVALTRLNCVIKIAGSSYLESMPDCLPRERAAMIA